jgi:prepilin-type processing-associated H-X9-DG protein
MNNQASPVSPHPKKSSLAILSEVSGVLGLICILPVIGSVLAIVFGTIALRQINKSNGTLTGRDRAVAGLVLGCIGLVILPLGAVALSRALNRAQEKGLRSVCRGNEKNIAIACLEYARDNDDRLPRSFEQVKGYWLSKNGFDLSPKLFTCPSVRNPAAQSYQIVGGDRKLADIKDPAHTPLIVENPSDHYGDGSNIAYVDGHAEWVPSKGRASTP